MHQPFDKFINFLFKIIFSTKNPKTSSSRRPIGGHTHFHGTSNIHQVCTICCALGQRIVIIICCRVFNSVASWCNWINTLLYVVAIPAQIAIRTSSTIFFSGWPIAVKNWLVDWKNIFFLTKDCQCCDNFHIGKYYQQPPSK